MPAPGHDYINEAIDAVVAALKASPYFMSPDAPDAPPDAVGPIITVETDIPETTRLDGYQLPHATVAYLEHGPNDDGSRGHNDYLVEIGIRLYHRGADRPAVWKALQQAAAAVTKLAEDEMAGERLDGFATLIYDRGGAAIDTEEKGGYGALLFTGLDVHISRYY